MKTIGIRQGYGRHQHICNHIIKSFKKEIQKQGLDIEVKRIKPKEKADVILMWDSYWKDHLGDGILVGCTHTIDAKGGWLSSPTLSNYDYICVEGKHIASQVKHPPKKEIWVIGNPLWDDIFKMKDQFTLTPNILDLNIARPTFLYAPTWEPWLSSFLNIGAYLIDFWDENEIEANLIIHLHTFIGLGTSKTYTWEQIKEGLNHLEKSAEEHAKKFNAPPGFVSTGAHQLERHYIHTHRRVSIVHSNVPIIPLMHMSDYLISDFSGCIFMYSALDRPILLYDNPGNVERSDSLGMEWRDIGDRFDSLESLLELIKEVMSNPEKKSDIRKKYIDKIFDENLRDGNATQRLVDKVLRILDK